MTLRGLVVCFLSSRGGLIVLSAMLAVIIRCTMWSFQIKDYIVASTIVILWPVIEYSSHRWILHEWSWTPFRKTHDRHHANPTTSTGLPDMWVIVLYYINSILLIFTTSGLYTAYTTILVMLSIYEFIHFSCHCNYTPKTWWGWSVRINHLQHHKLESRDRYAMSLPIIKATKPATDFTTHLKRNE